jgi:hypothetical protein
MNNVASTAMTMWRLRALLMAPHLPFAYTRFGDGELDLILGRGIAAGQPSHPQLVEEMRELWEMRREDGALNALATHDPEPGMTRELFLGWDNPAYSAFKGRPMDNAIALHYYAVFKPHVLRQFFDLIRDRKKLVIMSDASLDLMPLVGSYDLTIVPAMDAYATIDQWYPHTRDHDLILMACGAAKCAANLRLLREDRFVQSIDLGSLADYALGIESRSWITVANREFPESREIILG